MDTAQAVTYLRDRHSLKYNAEYLQLLARQGKVPSHKVGKNVRFRPSLLDQWALGEWRPKKVPQRKRKAS